MTDSTLEAERSLLGAVLLSDKTLDEWTVSPDDFGHPTYRAIAGAMRFLASGLQPITPLTVADLLEQRGLGASVPLEAVADLLASVATSDAGIVRHYSGMVLDAALRRQLQADLGAVSFDLAQGRLSNAEAVERTQRAASQVLDRMTRQDRYAAMPELAKELYAELEVRSKDKAISGLATGFGALDEHLGGLRPGVLTVLGGRTSTGKSAMARSIADNLTAAGHGVHYFSLEDSRLMLVERQMADMARVDLSVLAHPADKDHGLRNGDMKNLAAATNRLRARANWGVEDQPVMSSGSIAASVRRRRQELGTRAVVVDYVQLVREKADSPRERVNACLLGLLKLAREENVAVVVLSQVGRDQEKESRMPRLSDLKESGAIEEQASCVLLLHREKDDPKSGAPGKAGVIVAKNKHGARDLWVPLLWDGPTATYRSQRTVGGHAL